MPEIGYISIILKKDQGMCLQFISKEDDHPDLQTRMVPCIHPCTAFRVRLAGLRLRPWLCR
jgi:hypothetical protein